MRPPYPIVDRDLKCFTVIALDLKAAKLHIRFFALNQMFDTIEMRHAIPLRQLFVQFQGVDLLLPRFGDIDIDGTLRIQPTRRFCVEQVADLVD